MRLNQVLPERGIFCLATLLCALQITYAQQADDWQVTTTKAQKLNYKLERLYGGTNDLTKWKEYFEKEFSTGNIAALRYLLNLAKRKQLHFDINETTNNGTYLHRAVTFKDAARTSLLLEYGANPNISDADGNYPLHIAINARSNSSVAALLNQKNVDLTIKTKTGDSLLTLALLNHNCTLAESFVSKGLEFNSSTKISGQSSIEWALKADNLCAIRMLVPTPDDATKFFESESGRTLLHRAVDRQAETVIKYLLTIGVNHETKDNNGWTAFDLARANKDLDTALLIADRYPVYYSAVDNQQETLIHEVLDIGSPRLIADVLNRKPFLYVFNAKGALPKTRLEEHINRLNEIIYQLKSSISDPKYDAEVEQWNNAHSNLKPRPTSSEVTGEIERTKLEHDSLKKLLTTATKLTNDSITLISSNDEKAIQAIFDKLRPGISASTFCQTILEQATTLSFVAKSKLSKYGCQGSWQSDLNSYPYKFIKDKAKKFDWDSKLEQQLTTFDGRIGGPDDFDAATAWLSYRTPILDQQSSFERVKRIIDAGANLAFVSDSGATALDLVAKTTFLSATQKQELEALMLKHSALTGAQAETLMNEVVQELYEGQGNLALNKLTDFELCGLHDQINKFSILEYALLVGRLDIASRFINKCNVNLNWKLGVLLQTFGNESTTKTLHERYPMYEWPEGDQPKCSALLTVMGLISETFLDRTLDIVSKTKRAVFCSDKNFNSLFEYVDDQHNQTSFTPELKLHLFSGPHAPAIAATVGKTGMPFLIKLAIQNRHDDFLNLIKHGADPNLEDANHTPAWVISLEQKIANKDFKIRELLSAAVAGGADLHNVDGNGNTVYHIMPRLFLADDADNPSAYIKTMQSLGANINQPNKRGQTPLDVSSWGSVTKALLDHGADPFAPTKDKQTVDENYTDYVEKIKIHYYNYLNRHNLISDPIACSSTAKTLEPEYLSARSNFDFLFKQYEQKVGRFAAAWKQKNSLAMIKLASSPAQMCCADLTLACYKRLRLAHPDEKVNFSSDEQTTYCSLVQPLQSHTLRRPDHPLAVDGIIGISKRGNIDFEQATALNFELLLKNKKQHHDRIQEMLNTVRSSDKSMRMQVGIINRYGRTQNTNPDFSISVELPSQLPLKTQIKSEYDRLLKKFHLTSLDDFWRTRYRGCAELFDESKLSIDNVVKLAIPQKTKSVIRNQQESGHTVR